MTAQPEGDARVAGQMSAEIVSALRESGALFAFLHGSRTSGSAGAESDIDIGAYFGRPIDIVDVLGRLPGRVDLVVLDDAPLELAGRIALHGWLVFDDDPPKRVAWQATVRKIYLDEKPRVERARKDFIEGMRRRG